MAEEIRSIKVRVEVDTNKRTEVMEEEFDGFHWAERAVREFFDARFGNEC